MDSLEPIASMAQEYTFAMKTILDDVFRSEGISDYTINLVLCDDEFLSDLKERYFHVHQYTDVIAFRLNESVSNNGYEIEGEIYVSLPRVQANAQTYNQQPGRELARVIIHGGLHLIGFDDKDPESKKAMHEKEDAYLKEISWQILDDVWS